MYVMSTDVHQDFLMDLVDVVSNCFGEYHFVLDCVIYTCEECKFLPPKHKRNAKYVVWKAPLKWKVAQVLKVEWDSLFI